MLDIHDMPFLYTSFRSRHINRNVRIDLIREVIAGNISAADTNSDNIDNRSPNLIQVALEDTAESAALIPTIRVAPCDMKDKTKRQAQKMEHIAGSIMDASSMEVMMLQTMADLTGCGMHSWLVFPNKDLNTPTIQRRDPVTCYPEPGWQIGDTVRRCMFTREVFLSQLPEEQILLFHDGYYAANMKRAENNMKLILIEWFDETEFVVCALYEAGGSPLSISGTVTRTYQPVELSRVENKTGICPVVVGSRLTFDGEIRGQFDQAIAPFMAHVRLSGLMLDYADQAVYSDIWVRDLIGEMPFGGGSYIELGPNGAIGRVPPAASSLDIQRDLASLVDAVHLGARWPKSRPGEISQSIASAKFLEASAGMMNTAIRTLHIVMKQSLAQALTVGLAQIQKHFPGDHLASATIKNQHVSTEYNGTKDINLDCRVNVEYGLGFGRDPGQTAVLNVQYGQAGYISKQTVMENIDGLTDVGRELMRIELEELEGFMKAKLMQRLQEGSVPDSALLDIADARAAGDSLSMIYRKYVVEPMNAASAQAPVSGLAGGPVGPDGAPIPSPGGAPPPGMVPPPAPPNPMAALAGMPAGPGAPGARVGTLARMGMAAGPGGKLGVQVKS